jgi:hypothetical protein
MRESPVNQDGKTLSQPKRFGAWGFHNIFSFSKALAVMTL